MPASAAESTFYISIITGQKDRALRGPLALWSARSILLLIEQYETEFEHIIIEKPIVVSTDHRENQVTV